MSAKVFLVIKADGPETFPTKDAALARAIDWVATNPTLIATLAETTDEVYIPPQTPVVMPVSAPPTV